MSSRRFDALRRWWPRSPDRHHAPNKGQVPGDGENKGNNHRQQLGRRAEDLALAHLEAAGLTRIDRNVRAGRGEIDLILRDGDTLVFVEVRARSQDALVTAAESVSARKCAKIRETAARLIAARPDWQSLYCRFDVVAITTNDQQKPDIDWLLDAF